MPVLHQRGHVLHRYALGHNHDGGRISHHADGREVLDRVVVQLLHGGVDAMRTDVAQHQRVAVRRLAGDIVGRNRALRAGLVHHDNGLAEEFAYFLAHHARQHVVAAACGGGHDQRNRAFGVVSLRHGACGQQHGSGAKGFDRVMLHCLSPDIAIAVL
ncbi:hypothetical protein D3C73_1190870 [compost metagenome]